MIQIFIYPGDFWNSFNFPAQIVEQDVRGAAEVVARQPTAHKL
jgi:hypothetical protein